MSRVVALEGAAPVAETAEAVKDAASRANGALRMISQSKPEAEEHFDQDHRALRVQLERFIKTARSAMNTP